MVSENSHSRGVAQLGRALRSGRRGRVFESRHSDVVIVFHEVDKAS